MERLCRTHENERRLLLKDVRLDRGTSFTLREAEVIGPRSEKRLAREPMNHDDFVPVLTAACHWHEKSSQHKPGKDE